jgi:hypothetical protein
VRPAQLDALLSLLKRDEDDTADALLASLWHASPGDGRLRVIASEGLNIDAHAAALRRLRAPPHQTSVRLALERAPPELKLAFEAATGVESSTERLSLRVKQQLDPHATFWKR